MRQTKNRIIFFILGLSSIFLIISCKKPVTGVTREELAISSFIKERGITAEPTESGLYYIELKSGTGEYPILSDTVETYYKGMFLDGRVFDSRLSGETFDFPFLEGRVIRGWEEGLSYMKSGGEAMLIIPSDLAYGNTGAGAIPGSTPILFEVKLINIRIGPNHDANTE